MKFNIVIGYHETKVFEVSEDTWQEAVEAASNLADEEGLDTVGAFQVLDGDSNPVDTFEDI